MRLLIIGDLGGQFGAASKIAKNNGANVKQITNIEAALLSLRSGQGADLIFIDVKHDIADLITKMTAEHICTPVVACGFDNNTEKAVKAINDGAKEYITLPPDEILIAAILQSISKDEDASFISESPTMKEIIKLVDKVAKSDANILVTGESGTGKEVISRYIHKKSNRSNKNLISVNCAAIPDNLLESELFGHEKGAFTGAIARRIGKFEEAHNGTLLLDEISEIDIRLQAKLLRAIQEQEIDRVGGAKPIKLNLRIIATSNRNLEKEVDEGRFREDLFFRLNIINIHLPPLRERKEDIISFANHFIKKYSDKNQLTLSQEASSFLLKYNWRGNVRELENTIHRAVLLSSNNIITKKELMLQEASQDNMTNANLVGRTIESVEKELIISTLDHCLGDPTHAANILGISINSLRNKLANYENEKMDIAQGNGS